MAPGSRWLEGGLCADFPDPDSWSRYQSNSDSNTSGKLVDQIYALKAFKSLYSVGVAADGVDWKVIVPKFLIHSHSLALDLETGKVLGQNQCGELMLKTDILFKGYHNYDSSDTLDSKGWLKSGDLAYYNDENCVFIVDRIKDTFKYKAYRIFPSYIEPILLDHPIIKNAVVLGLPHETEGFHPMALIELLEGELISAEEVVKFVEKRVSDKYRLRGGVKIVGRI
ncbi:luciferin 4-monooxygenase-like [Photinus pyralis]|uniref:luciferin 4-monooxygenase-like n=1 Tax=Photinus pyralis TaxID=7054 RepID=UPI0012678059|nr:luciferin 4-monooxygenase-like [Photinus pyralis]